MERREPEWRLEDVALLQAQADREADVGPHGQPMSEALDSDADPMLRGRGWLYESYYYRDYAAQAQRIAQERLKNEYGEHALDDLVFGVRRVPKLPIPAGGG